MKAILHVDRRWGIGRGNTLMFRLPADMKFFRETTTGNTVLMGKNTFLSFPNGPLKNRTNIVLSSTMEEGEGYTLVRNRRELSAILHETKGEVYLIGGASLYREFFPECSEIFVTKVDADGAADVFVPNLDKDDRFVLSCESEPIETNGYVIRFCTYRNRSL